MLHCSGFHLLHIFSAVIQLSNVEILSETNKVVKSYLLEQIETLQSETKLETRFTGGKI